MSIGFRVVVVVVAVELKEIHQSINQSGCVVDVEPIAFSVVDVDVELIGIVKVKLQSVLLLVLHA